jgi:hypothetical protein
MNLNVAVMDKQAECQQLVNKLTAMKQQMIDNEMQYSMEKRFGAVRIGSFSSTPCTVSQTPEPQLFVMRICVRLDGSR